MCFGASRLGTCMLISIMSSGQVVPFIIIEYPCLSLVVLFILKSISSDISTDIPLFLYELTVLKRKCLHNSNFTNYEKEILAVQTKLLPEVPEIFFNKGERDV